MKKLLLSAVMYCGCISGFAQSNTTVEKSVWNVQTGFFGVFVNNEYRLGDALALRTELGLDLGVAANLYETKWGLIPTINVEPRYYYNIAKRAAKGKNTSGNASNFVTVLVKYNADWFLISNDNNIITENRIAVIPKWALRRNIGQSKFNYEAGMGIGYYSYIGSDRRYYDHPESVAVDAHLRIGYRF